MSAADAQDNQQFLALQKRATKAGITLLDAYDAPPVKVSISGFVAKFAAQRFGFWREFNDLAEVSSWLDRCGVAQ